jgi:hypothetical protein
MNELSEISQTQCHINAQPCLCVDGALGVFISAMVSYYLSNNVYLERTILESEPFC